MTRYTYTKAINADKLAKEIKALDLPYSYIETNGGTQVCIFMTQDLDSAQEAQLTACVIQHDPFDLRAAVLAKIVAARTFGSQLINNFAADNVLAGYTVDQIQDIITRTAKAQDALRTGSLYVAITELNNVVTDDQIITPAKVKYYRNQIEDYLKLPRT